MLSSADRKIPTTRLMVAHNCIVWIYTAYTITTNNPKFPWIILVKFSSKCYAASQCWTWFQEVVIIRSTNQRAHSPSCYVLHMVATTYILHLLLLSIALTQWSKGCWIEAVRLPSDIVKRSTSDRKLPVGGSLVANSMTSNDGIASRSLEMTLRRRAIKIWVLCHDKDGRLCADLGQFRIQTRGMFVR